MIVQCKNCGLTYDESNPNCPQCAHRTPTHRIKWNSPPAAEQLLTKRQATTEIAVGAVQNLVKQVGGYSMDGAMEASTTVRLPGGKKSFVTMDNMHSEMVALQYMLDAGYWQLYLGLVVDAEQNGIEPAAFTTVEPHCGFCTVFLKVLGLPLGTATRGNYKFAVNYNYPLPKQVRHDRWVLARLLGGSYDAFPDIKRLLNSFVSEERWMLEISRGVLVSNEGNHVKPEPDVPVISWEQIVEHEDVLTKVWAHIFKSIYEKNK